MKFCHQYPYKNNYHATFPKKLGYFVTRGMENTPIILKTKRNIENNDISLPLVVKKRTYYCQDIIEIIESNIRKSFW